jgi:hypothetical protein
MMLLSYQSFVEQKIKTAQAIAMGCCDGTYAEGAIILCSIISAMSAIAWPDDKKHRIDRKRFVEIITRFPPSGIDPKKMSIPLLVQDGKACNSRLGIPKAAFYLTGANDLNETDVEKSCPGLSLCKIRKYSYANLLYEQIRCGYAHQYRTGHEASDHDSLRPIAKVKESVISYVNVNSDNTIYRFIHFPLHWIASVAEGIALGLDNESSKKGKMLFDDLCFEVPKPWWLDG